MYSHYEISCREKTKNKYQVPIKNKIKITATEITPLITSFVITGGLTSCYSEERDAQLVVHLLHAPPAQKPPLHGSPLPVAHFLVPGFRPWCCEGC
jgi:hypothetical protein